MNNKHNKNKKTLKIVGYCTLIPGVILTIIGFISFFVSSSSMEMPSLFFLDFIGIPLIFVGSTCLRFGYRREVATYIKNESVPVAKELYQDLKPEVNDLVGTIKGEKAQNKICPKCQTVNDSDSRFCDACGTPLIKTCPNCNSLVDFDDKFCPRCGNKLD